MTVRTKQAPLGRLEVARGLRVSLWEAVWSTVWAVLTTGFFQTGFALFLGASPFALGLLAGLPAAVNLLQLPASLYAERRGERKPLVAVSSLLGRLLWIPILFVPFVLPPGARLPVFLVLLVLSSASLAVSVPAWTSWISDLVPAGSRGQYFARRNMLASVVTMIAPLPAGAFLDQAVKYNQFDPRIGFAVLFGLAAIAAVGAAVMLNRQPEPPRERSENSVSANLVQSLTAPLSDRAFRPFLLFAALMVCGQTLAGQFFTAWQVGRDALNLPYLTVQILGVFAAGAGLAATPLWGYLSDKYGARPVLVLSTVGTITAPLIWTLTRPGAGWINLALIVLLNICSGASWAGVGLTQFSMLIGSVSPEKRSTYVAMFSAVNGIVGGVSPILGGSLMGLLEPFHVGSGPNALNNYKILFLLTALIRVVCAGLLTRVHAGTDRPTRYVLDQLANARPLTSYRALRRLSQPSNEQARQETVEALTEIKSPLAVEELVEALDDVSSGVRERAVRALGAIGDARAVGALAAKLGDPVAGIGEIAADALGEIGDAAATPFLIRAAHGPDANVRVAALRALARLADPTAFPALLAALDLSRPTSCEAACRALGQTAMGKPGLTSAQAEEALPRLLYLLSQEAERGLRFAAARALDAFAPLLQTRPDAYEALRTRAHEEADAAVLAQEASALGRLGRATGQNLEETARLLLSILDRPGLSGLAYKQILEAVADHVLRPGAFYPYLGMNEAARDQAAARLLTELRREAHLADTQTAPALEAFASADFGTFWQVLRPFLPTSSAPGIAAAALFRRAAANEGTSHEALLGLQLAGLHTP